MAYLDSNSDWMGRSIKSSDRANTAAPVDAGGPKGLFPNAVRGNHTQTGHGHSAHDLFSARRERRLRVAIVLLCTPILESP